MGQMGIAKSTGYKRANGKGCAQVKAHLKYIEQRPNELGQRQKREIFNEQDNVKRQDFQDKLNDQAKKYPGGVLAHKVVLAAQKGDVAKNVDMKEVTRATIAEYEAKTGQKLDYVAVKHGNHVHVVILGRDKSGKEVVIKPQDLKKLQNIFDKQIKRQLERNRGRGWGLDRDIPELSRTPIEYAQAMEQKMRQVVQGLKRTEGRGHGAGKSNSLGVKISHDEHEL